ncbi:hypothetical protein SVAN01_08122 [Stagonosporopsis vannaccii]|nr:hypothetical protein SVAN01_08122 [Stagonosporopsis vannaccii]
MHWTFLFCLGLLALLPFAVSRHTGSECTVRSNVSIVSDVAAAPVQHGAASQLQAGTVYPWPEVERNGRKLRVVTYCYSNEAVRTYFDCPYVRDALNRWREKLDSPPFKGTTNLVWEELNDGNKDPSKRQPRYCFDANRNWDHKNVPDDTLWINIDPSRLDGGVAMVGYVKETEGGKVGYNHMKLGPHVTVDVITHEFGHVFGMVHEQQRHDRDDYLLFECKNLEHYDQTIARARVDKKLNYEDAHQKLCHDEAFAREYNFGAQAYIKDPEGKVHDEPGPFDVDSIMMYASTYFANVPCFSDKKACPLLKYTQIGHTIDRSQLERIKKPTHPSDGDAKFIQRWYPSAP